MIVLALAVVALGILAYVALMRSWWETETNRQIPEVKTIVTLWYAKLERFCRRGRFALERRGAHAFAWSKGRLEEGFFKIFPSARSAFEEHDPLTGLTHGPSSYFLHSITETRRRKK